MPPLSPSVRVSRFRGGDRAVTDRSRYVVPADTLLVPPALHRILDAAVCIGVADLRRRHQVPIPRELDNWAATLRDLAAGLPADPRVSLTDHSITVAEAATMLGLSERQTRALAQAGRIRKTRRSRPMLLALDDVMTAVEDRQTSATTATDEAAAT
jgi:excisionase family DNA binding protein